MDIYSFFQAATETTAFRTVFDSIEKTLKFANDRYSLYTILIYGGATTAVVALTSLFVGAYGRRKGLESHHAENWWVENLEPSQKIAVEHSTIDRPARVVEVPVFRKGVPAGHIYLLESSKGFGLIDIRYDPKYKRKVALLSENAEAFKQWHGFDYDQKDVRGFAFLGSYLAEEALAEDPTTMKKGRKRALAEEKIRRNAVSVKFPEATFQEIQLGIFLQTYQKGRMWPDVAHGQFIEYVGTTPSGEQATIFYSPLVKAVYLERNGYPQVSMYIDFRFHSGDKSKPQWIRTERVKVQIVKGKKGGPPKELFDGLELPGDTNERRLFVERWISRYRERIILMEVRKRAKFNVRTHIERFRILRYHLRTMFSDARRDRKKHPRSYRALTFIAGGQSVVRHVIQKIFNARHVPMPDDIHPYRTDVFSHILWGEASWGVKDPAKENPTKKGPKSDLLQRLYTNPEDPNRPPPNYLDDKWYQNGVIEYDRVLTFLWNIFSKRRLCTTKPDLDSFGRIRTIHRSGLVMHWRPGEKQSASFTFDPKYDSWSDFTNPDGELGKEELQKRKEEIQKISEKDKINYARRIWQSFPPYMQEFFRPSRRDMEFCLDSEGATIYPNAIITSGQVNAARLQATKARNPSGLADGQRSPLETLQSHDGQKFKYVRDPLKPEERTARQLAAGKPPTLSATLGLH